MRTAASPLRRMLGAATSSVAALALGAALLAGCSSDDGGDTGSGDAGSSAATTSDGSAGTGSGSSSGAEPGDGGSETAEPYLPVPEGVELTEPGTELELGDTAVVAWEPRQKTVGVLEITVNRLERTTFEKSFEGWKLEPAVRRTTPYFVRARVANVGDTDLGGVEVPLYIVDAKNTLVRYSRFASTFEPCDSGDLPKKFRPGQERDVCLVYLAPDRGRLTAVSFRPTEEFDPITWTGKVRTLGEPAKPGKKKN
ncbi:hypothetical protein GHK92_05840 [Nocardioides sp. dk4132]|uniref:hypothetical protein n=1 Tax=unclassified Nocardioides TaxID=2615069 RepID=UPI0012969D39|nr:MULTISPECIES: hypothetical protein [unclassified Nocardioides]MQW75388.1 hypothetical protein [Nocardioides sp. dk4132]QGA08316.1 hypothetical protein GFH29_13590 [Nocardioides sp. dk884]